MTDLGVGSRCDPNRRKPTFPDLGTSGDRLAEHKLILDALSNLASAAFSGLRESIIATTSWHGWR